MNLTGQRCECPSCGQLFNRVSTFDKHRVGEFAKPGEWAGDRRCLTSDEMSDKGWRLNDKGFWLTEAREIPAAWANTAMEAAE